jgi:hypothetical protein
MSIARLFAPTLKLFAAAMLVGSSASAEVVKLELSPVGEGDLITIRSRSILKDSSRVRPGPTGRLESTRPWFTIDAASRDATKERPAKIGEQRNMTHDRFWKVDSMKKGVP